MPNDREDILNMIKKELTSRGLEYTIENGKNHTKVKFIYDGQKRVLINSRSHKNQARLIHNVRGNLRRMCR